MKKGFSLVELLVSLVIISMVVVFISSFVLNLRDEKGNINIDVKTRINQTSISRRLNYDVIKFGGISDIASDNAEHPTYTIIYNSGDIRKLKLSKNESSNSSTLKYWSGDDDIELLVTLNGTKSFVEELTLTSNTYGSKTLREYVIMIKQSEAPAEVFVEVVDYSED